MGVNQLTKLRAMSMREIASRTAYKGYLAWERRRHHAGGLTAPDRLRRSLHPDLVAGPDWPDALLRRSSGAVFFPALGDPAVVRAHFGTVYADELVKARRIADDVVRNDIEFFGERFSFGDRIDWNADPVTGARWPRVYHADVPVHGGNGGFGDVKHVWELNRHQFLMDLAKVALLDGSELHRRKLQTLVDDYQREVPYATGAPWACALEPAFRAWSWLWAYHFVRADGPLEARFHLAWLTGFLDHGRFLYRHLETHSSPYNHLIGEASALFALGLLFPEFRESTAWVARGRQVLESTVDSQFHADGGSVEQSTFYHHATLGFYLLAAILGRGNGQELSAAIWGAIERGVAFSMSIAQPDGRVPRVGGADDGKPIRLEHLPFFDFRPYQAIGAVLFSRADFKYAAGRFWEDAYWLLGSEGARAFEALPSEPPPLAAALPASGYYMARSSWAKDADYLCFDCGPQAAGLRRDDVPSAAHGHADCLSVVVTLGGREVLVDPGFFCYNGDPEWEVQFRKTRLHNTVSVDGADQAKHLSKMAWTRTYAPTVEGWSADGRLAWARGSHDGFRRLPQPVIHRRTAWLRPDGYVLVYDELTGEGEHTIEVTFQFGPGTLDLRQDHVLFDNAYQLRWLASAPMQPSVAKGGAGPADGWIATSLGVRQAAPRLRLAGSMSSGRLAVVSIVADVARCSARSALSVGDVLTAVVDGRTGWFDDVVAGAAGTMALTGLETDAPLVALRWRDGVLEQACQAGGTRVRAKETLRPVGDGAVTVR
jgi:hypothetical protein